MVPAKTHPAGRSGDFEKALAFPRALVDVGVPVFVAPPNPMYDPALSHAEFLYPPGWQHTGSDARLLDQWRPGWAICMVTGHGLDGVDVDTKNGADVDRERERLLSSGATILGEVTTPGRGAHFYVRSTGIGTSNNTVLGVDYRGGCPDGSSTGFLFLPGTQRPKYQGRGYEAKALPNLRSLVNLDADAQHVAIAAYLAPLGADQPSSVTSVPAITGEPVDVGSVPASLYALLTDYGPSFITADGASSTDRSARFHHIVGECRRTGYSQGQTVTLVAPWCRQVRKYADRVAEEVARCWPKVDPKPEALPGAGGPDPNAPLDLPCPDFWFDKQSLKVADLSASVQREVLLRHDAGDQMWSYQHGVWRPDREQVVRSCVTKRLGNRSRPAHTESVRHYLLGQTDVIGCEPVPDLINVRNGLLDWSSGDLRPHDPDVLSTVQLNTAWDSQAKCPTITGWLGEVLPPDLLVPTDDGPGFIWEVIGYLCMSGNPLQKALLLIGNGRNGKGTLIRLLTALLGHENVASVDLHSLATNRFRKAELVGKVANLAGDIDSAWLESTAEFKAITGGDSITGERKYGDPFDFTPFAVPVYSANKIFGTPDHSAGFLARWVVITFPNTFLGREDRTLDTRLAAPEELAGMLAKGVQGLRAVMARGNFSDPPSVARARERFEDEVDPVRRFLREATEADPEGWASRRQIRRAYEDHCTDIDDTKPMTPGALYSGLEAAGLAPRTRKGDRGFAGIRLVEPE